MMKNLLLLFLLIATPISLWAQDSCDSPEAVTLDTVYSVGEINGDVPDNFCFGSGANDAEWYTFTPSETAYYNITSDLPQNFGRDSRLNVYTGDCGSLTCVGYDDDSGSVYLSFLTMEMEADQTYYLVWDNRWGGSANNFDFKVELGVAPPSALLDFDIFNIPTSGFGICAADMNGDYLDDVVAVSNDNVNIHYQMEDGTFTEVNIPVTSSNAPDWSMAVGDLNGDMLNDMLLGGGGGNSFLISDGEGGYSHYTSGNYVFSQRTNFSDLNNDGILDAFSCHDVQPNVFYINDGGANLTYYQGGMGDVPNGGNYGSIFVDYDNDGDSDLFIAKCRGGSSTININEMHRNNGDGTYTEVAASIGLADPVQTWSSAWGDFDNDGDMDALVGANSFSDGGHKWMQNDGDGTFSDITAGSIFEVFNEGSREYVTHDFDNNGWIDVFTNSGGGMIFLNQGDGTFLQSTAPYVGAVADLNNDGWLDIYRGDNIYFNNSDNGNNWLKITTLGTVSNNNGIGARVELYANGMKQIRDVRSGDGFEYMSSLNTHFGLGEATTIDQVIVRWPSGIVDTYHDIEVNTTLFAVEGETLSVTDVTAAHKLKLYPNPARDFIHISSDIELEQKAQLIDLSGKAIPVEIVDDRIQLRGIRHGVYFLNVTDVERNEYTEKILIKN